MNSVLRTKKRAWLARDPLKRFETYLTGAINWSTAAELKAIRQRIQATVDEAVTFAEQSPEPKAEELYRYIFAD
jgi:pyruvate dehydrogenase E1 component alpha subunit